MLCMCSDDLKEDILVRLYAPLYNNRFHPCILSCVDAKREEAI